MLVIWRIALLEINEKLIQGHDSRPLQEKTKMDDRSRMDQIIIISCFFHLFLVSQRVRTQSILLSQKCPRCCSFDHQVVS